MSLPALCASRSMRITGHRQIIGLFGIKNTVHKDDFEPVDIGEKRPLVIVKERCRRRGCIRQRIWGACISNIHRAGSAAPSHAHGRAQLHAPVQTSRPRACSAAMRASVCVGFHSRFRHHATSARMSSIAVVFDLKRQLRSTGLHDPPIRHDVHHVRFGCGPGGADSA